MTNIERYIQTTCKIWNNKNYCTTGFEIGKKFMMAKKFYLFFYVHLVYMYSMNYHMYMYWYVEFFIALNILSRTKKKLGNTIYKYMIVHFEL